MKLLAGAILSLLPVALVKPNTVFPPLNPVMSVPVWNVPSCYIPIPAFLLLGVTAVPVTGVPSSPSFIENVSTDAAHIIISEIIISLSLSFLIYIKQPSAAPVTSAGVSDANTLYAWPSAWLTSCSLVTVTADVNNWLTSFTAAPKPFTCCSFYL